MICLPALVRGVLFFTVIAVFAAAAAPLAAQSSGGVFFEDFLANRLGPNDSGWDLEKFCPVSTNPVAAHVLASYGAMYAANEAIVFPDVCIQPGESAFNQYRKKLSTSPIDVCGIDLEFQTPATQSLKSAVVEIETRGLRLTPLDGRIAGARTYGDTLRLWNSRFFPALEFWIKRGRLTESDRLYIGGLDLDKKVAQVLEWESRGIFFSTDRSRSIMTSTAPPGGSQHLALIALDVSEYWNADVRQILNRNGWFQTIVDDPPHFTYLGLPENQLPSRGLRAVWKGGFQFWIPNLRPKPGTS